MTCKSFIIESDSAGCNNTAAPILPEAAAQIC